MSIIDRLLDKVDCLGFGESIEAKHAIIGHSDWFTRWDVFGPLSIEEIRLINDYRKAYLTGDGDKLARLGE